MVTTQFIILKFNFYTRKIKILNFLSFWYFLKKQMKIMKFLPLKIDEKLFYPDFQGIK